MKSELRLYFPKIQLRWGALALFALALQAVAIFVPLGLDDVPKRLLFVLSYLVLLVFVVLNFARPGLLIIGVGLLFNFAAIISNGGLMPVTPEAFARIGESDKIQGLEEGDAIPSQKEVLKSRENTHLYFLSDRIVWDNPISFRIFSIGDVVIAGGLVVTLGDLFLPRVKRETRRRESPSRVNP